jgi:hypothetical protein
MVHFVAGKREVDELQIKAVFRLRDGVRCCPRLAVDMAYASLE